MPFAIIVLACAAALNGWTSHAFAERAQDYVRVRDVGARTSWLACPFTISTWLMLAAGDHLGARLGQWPSFIVAVAVWLLAGAAPIAWHNLRRAGHVQRPTFVPKLRRR